VPAEASTECGNQILGCVEIRVPRPEAAESRMGYWVAREVLGRGVCIQAAVQALQWGFEQLNLERVELLIQPDNGASIAVAKKLGATFQERLEGAIAFHNQLKEADLYSVTAAELCQINPVKTRRSWPTSVEYLRKA
jgi:RimJ/RimL family protein N-acetyltransferase